MKCCIYEIHSSLSYAFKNYLSWCKQKKVIVLTLYSVPFAGSP